MVAGSKKKYAFTMAEMLIVLTVVGTMATVIMYAISSVKPDSNVVMFKKAFYVTEKIIAEMLDDDALYPKNTSPGLSNQNTEAYHNGEVIKSDATTSSIKSDAALGASKFCAVFARKVNTTGTVNCTTDRVAFTSTGTGGGNFRTADGVVWRFPVKSCVGTGTQPAADLQITIDVNGPKKHNCEDNVTTGCTKSGYKYPDQFNIYVKCLSGKIYIKSGDKAESYLKTRAYGRK